MRRKQSQLFNEQPYGNPTSSALHSVEERTATEDAQAAGTNVPAKKNTDAQGRLIVSPPPSTLTDPASSSTSTEAKDPAESSMLNATGAFLRLASWFDGPRDPESRAATPPAETDTTALAPVTTPAETPATVVTRPPVAITAAESSIPQLDEDLNVRIPGSLMPTEYPSLASMRSVTTNTSSRSSSGYVIPNTPAILPIDTPPSPWVPPVMVSTANRTGPSEDADPDAITPAPLDEDPDAITPAPALPETSSRPPPMEPLRNHLGIEPYSNGHTPTGAGEVPHMEPGYVDVPRTFTDSPSVTAHTHGISYANCGHESEHAIECGEADPERCAYNGSMMIPGFCSDCNADGSFRRSLRRFGTWVARTANRIRRGRPPLSNVFGQGNGGGGRIFGTRRRRGGDGAATSDPRQRRRLSPRGPTGSSVGGAGGADPNWNDGTDSSRS